jgi:hypothetical protein
VNYAKPFVRTGTLMSDSFSDTQTVYVSRDFPAALATELNTRFDVYGGVMTLATMSPPDKNVRQFLAGTTSSGWMNPPANKQTATGKVTTFPYTASDIVAADYGVLWSYAVPLRFLARTPFAATPSEWKLLYPRDPSENLIAPGLFPTGLAYNKAGGTYFLAPTHASVAKRRVLNVPLLDCTSAPPPVGVCQTAKVLGVGKFFMTKQADAAGVYGEFAGLAAAPPSTATAVLVK